MVGVLDHGTEFIHEESTAKITGSMLFEENWTRAVKLDSNGEQAEYGSEGCDKNSSGEEI